MLRGNCYHIHGNQVVTICYLQLSTGFILEIPMQNTCIDKVAQRTEAEASTQVAIVAQRKTVWIFNEGDLLINV